LKINRKENSLHYLVKCAKLILIGVLLLALFKYHQLTILAQVQVEDTTSSSRVRAAVTNTTQYNYEDGKNGIGSFFINVKKGASNKKYTIKLKISNTAYTGSPRTFAYYGNKQNLQNENPAMEYSYNSSNRMRAELTLQSITYSGNDTYALAKAGAWFTYHDYYVGTDVLGGGPNGNWAVTERQYNLYMPFQTKQLTGYQIAIPKIGDSQRMLYDLDNATGNFLIKSNTNYCGFTNFTTDGGWQHNTLNIEYIPNNYSVKYDGNGSTGGSMTNSRCTYDEASTLKANEFTKTGYTFSGWNTQKDGQGNTYTNGETIKNLAATNIVVNLYAIWEPNNYYVKYNGNGSTEGVVGNSTHTYDKASKLSINRFVRSGYEYTGWNSQADGKGKSYADQASINNLSAAKGAIVNLYAMWKKKRFHIVYEGNGQTSGTNMVEYNIWVGDPYIFRPNVQENSVGQTVPIFEKVVNEIRETKKGMEYNVAQKYSFQGWEFDIINGNKMFLANDTLAAASLYENAVLKNAWVPQLPENQRYDNVVPIRNAGSGVNTPSGADVAVKQFIKLRAVWDAYPTIVVEPDLDDPNLNEQEQESENEGRRIEDDILYFYEGEQPNKEDLISHLTVMDAEDGDLKNKIKIKKIEYCDGAFISDDGKQKEGFTKEWEDDISAAETLDTYYLEMIQDEILTHFITYEVTDSVGNITLVELPVKVKYNNYPQIEAVEMYFYLKDDVNRGIITEAEVLGNGEAFDVEDKNWIKNKLELVGFDPQIFMMQSEENAEFIIKYKVTDSFQKTSYQKAKVVVHDPNVKQAKKEKFYVRFISNKYLNTLEQNSSWRVAESYSFLQSVLNNKSAMDTWYFTHKEIVDAKEWILAEGDGNWKGGQAANQEFYRLFEKCRKK
jgi:uncharacterized repeat protein (TIGR02543 family)